MPQGEMLLFDNAQKKLFPDTFLGRGFDQRVDSLLDHGGWRGGLDGGQIPQNHTSRTLPIQPRSPDSPPFFPKSSSPQRESTGLVSTLKSQQIAILFQFSYCFPSFPLPSLRAEGEAAKGSLFLWSKRMPCIKIWGVETPRAPSSNLPSLGLQCLSD